MWKAEKPQHSFLSLVKMLYSWSKTSHSQPSLSFLANFFCGQFICPLLFCQQLLPVRFWVTLVASHFLKCFYFSFSFSSVSLLNFSELVVIYLSSLRAFTVTKACYLEVILAKPMTLEPHRNMGQSRSQWISVAKLWKTPTMFLVHKQNQKMSHAQMTVTTPRHYLFRGFEFNPSF